MLPFFIYGSAFILLCVIIYGAWSRRQIYKEVDRLEARKMVLMNEPVTEELAKIKGLKMLGETEARFEQWRGEWDEIVTVQLPDIEEKLFDIEDYANKYRFWSSRKLIQFVEEELDRIKEQMDTMINEVDELVKSEKHNRSEIDQVAEQYQNLLAKYDENKNELASSGETFKNEFSIIDQQFQEFYEKTEEGNYLQARSILLEVVKKVKKYSVLIDEVPALYEAINEQLLSQIQELEDGIKEMETQGYTMSHFGFLTEVEKLKRQAIQLIPLIDQLRTDEIDNLKTTIENEIEDIFTKLEDEVKARQALESELPNSKIKLESIPSSQSVLVEEMDLIEKNYKVSEELKGKKESISQSVKQLINQYEQIESAKLENKYSFSTLVKMNHELLLEINTIHEEISSTREKLELLREDERVANEQLHSMKKDILKAENRLVKSNIPAIPEFALSKLNEADKKIEGVEEHLNKFPIAVNELKESVKEAEEYISKCVESIHTIVDQAMRTEKLIQYANRYRSKYDHVNILLLQSEDRFRSGHYEEGLEFVEEAINFIDPNLLEELNEL